MWIFEESEVSVINEIYSISRSSVHLKILIYALMSLHLLKKTHKLLQNDA